MTIIFAQLLADIEAETASLRSVLSALDDEAWSTQTPAEGWDVADQVSHLAYFDETATLSITDPDAFEKAAIEIESRPLTEGRDFADQLARETRGRPPSELLAWWDEARRVLVNTLRVQDCKRRVPWYGRQMSVMSSATARLMETWAHGVDIREAVGAPIVATDRLRHVAHLGVRTLGFSFAVHGLPVPETPVRVDLAAPGGGTWSFGPEGAKDRVSGSALDFCLIVVQRRNRADTALAVEGTTAQRWLEIAQAYAGPPATGRPAVDRDQHPCSGIV